MESKFYALIGRLKYINRWSLMRNSESENVAQHSHAVAVIAHALAVIENEFFGGNYNADRICTAAVFHDAGEVLTGDLPTPIKYFNTKISSAYGDIERYAAQKLLDMLPAELKPHYEPVVCENKSSDEYKIIKAADKIAAFIKCAEEVGNGNREFAKAKKTIKKELDAMMQELRCVDYFAKNCLPAFELSLDELG